MLTHLLNSVNLKIDSSLSLSKELFYVNSAASEREQQASDSSKVELCLKREYILLTMSAKGKAELYFHAYVWSSYAQMLSSTCPELQDCPQIQSLNKLSVKPK